MDCPQPCYFCQEPELNTCVVRSLYHKYSDAQSKILSLVDSLLGDPQAPKQKSIPVLKYQEIRLLVDEDEHMKCFYSLIAGTVEKMDMLEYYKYRQYVPVFSRGDGTARITESLHVFYYDRLKLYYNSVKRKLNITVEPSVTSMSSRSLSETISNYSMNQTQLLKGVASKETIRQFESESKALQDVLNYLIRNQQYMRKIKTLRTEDCMADPFRDDLHRKSKPGLLESLVAQNRGMKKKSKVFFRYIEAARSVKNTDSSIKLKLSKNKLQEISKDKIYNESLKLRSKSSSVSKLKNEGSKAKLQSKNNSKSKGILNSPYQPQNKEQKEYIRALPKIKMEFNSKPVRSKSSASIKNETNMRRQKQSCKKIPSPTPQQPKQSWKHIDTVFRYQTTRPTEPKQKSGAKLLVGPVRSPQQSVIEIDPADNLASINRKKIEELKLRSRKKKQKQDKN